MTAPAPRPSRTRRAWLWLPLGAAVVAAPVLLDYATVGRPVSAALSREEWSHGFAMSAHRQYRVNPGVLVLDLGTVEGAAPVDLVRGVFAAADALNDRGADFQRVHLSRGGKTIFTMEGSAFRELGQAYGAGDSSMPFVSTFPAKLQRPDGQPAFDQASGESLEAFGKRLEDVTAAVGQWMGADLSRPASY